MIIISSDSGVHADPEKMRSFIKRLKKFNNEVEGYFNEINRGINRLGKTWQDQEFKKFLDEIKPARSKLKKFVEENKKVLPKLERDAEKLEDFLKD